MEHVSFDGNTAESTADFSSYTLAYILGTAGHNPRVMTSSDEPYNQIITDDWSTASVQMNPLYESPTARALGGGGYIQNSSLQLVDATFSNNIASAQATSGAHASAAGGGLWMAGVRDTNLTSVEFIANKALSDQIAQGGAIYLNEGSLTLSSGIFSGNQVSGGNFDNAKGGAIYAASMILNVSDTVFTNNTAKGGVTQGGALFITNNSKLTYTISDNAAALRKTVTCSGNTAFEGGFLYLENSTADFVIGTNTKLVIADSIAGSGTITKSGADMEISAAIADSNIRWTVATGLLELSTVARTINLNNWTIGTDAMLRLSALNDTVNMSTDKKIGILDLGGGSDVINTGGYSLSDGQLLVSILTFTGGGHVSSEISTRTEDASFDITLANVVLDSNISGGNGDDIIRITQESTVGGIMNLGDGDNRITGTADVTFRSGLTLGKGDDTLSLTNATFASAVTLGDGNNSLTATGKAQFSGDVTGGKGRDTFTSKEITFDKKLDLGDGLNSITATGNAEFKGQVTLGKDKDALNFSDVVFENTLSLGDGDNTLTSTGEASFTSVSAGCGNDVFNLSSAGFSGALDLGDGDNSITVTSSLTCFDSVTAGAGNDTINLTGSDNVSTFSGMVDLGLGENYLYIEGNVTDNIDFMIHEGGRTTAVVYRGASINGKTVSVYSRPDANLKALTLDWSSFSGDEALDKVRILISCDATFSSYEYSIELYNRVTDFTINVEEGYFYQLQANDEDGWAQRYLDDTIAPDQVGGLTWSGDQARWDVTHDNWGGNGVKQYHVELSSDAEFNNVVESATVTTTEYAFTGITEGNYYWRVRAEDFTGNLGDWSETASVFVDLTAPTAPRGLTSTSGDYSVTLSWSAASDSGSGVALYEYRIATDSGFASITVSGESSSISDVTVNDLVYGTYYWQVRAIDNSGNVGQWSLYKTFSIADTIAPTAPGQLDYQLDGNSITLDWLASSDDTDGSGLKEYRIEFSNQSDFSQIIFSRTSTSTRITVDELSGGNYFCRVSAVDQSGNVSAWSNIQNFQIEGSVQSQTPSRSDINGNGVSDVLFQYTGGDYQLGFWLDGTNNWQGQGIPESADWDVIGAYDMSSDGQADVVMLGNVTVSGIRGAFVGYRKNGDMSSWENISYLTNAEGVDWQVKVGNLTGNEGKNSILWHAPDLGAVGVWTDGTDNWVSLGAGYDRNWEMIGAGDFDGDGADSILFSYANGAKYYALDLDQTATELGVSDSGWEVRAIGDFSGDGRDDIIAFNAATGLVAKWENGNSSSWSSLGQLDAADWFIAGAGDYNGDGADDLLVRQYSTGMLGYYADADLSKWNEMGRGVDMNWAVIA